MKRRILELCPSCMDEVFVVHDCKKDGYVTECPQCGNRLLLCSECIKNGPCDRTRDTDLCRGYESF